MFTRKSLPVFAAVALAAALVFSTSSTSSAAGIVYGTSTTGVVTTYYGPVYGPTAVVAPVAPTVVYRYGVPVYTPGVVVARPVYAAPRVLVRPKVYVAGQPVRNFWRAVTP